MHYSLVDHLIDLIQNSIEADASVVIVEFKNVLDEIEITISDDGKGMDPETLQKARDPFYSESGKHDKRKVGLGLPFIIQAMELVSGEIDIKSDIQLGTSIYFKYDKNKIDAPEIGDINQLLSVIFSMEGDHEIIFRRIQGGRHYQITRSELSKAVGDLNEVGAMILMKDYFLSLENELNTCSCTK